MQEKISTPRHSWIEKLKGLQGWSVKINIQHHESEPLILKSCGRLWKIALTENDIVIPSDETCNGFRRRICEPLIGAYFKVLLGKTLKGIEEIESPVWRLSVKE